VTRFRTFLNTDPPALTELWNRGIPDAATAKPLRVHELDAHAFGRIHFDPQGLFVAERDDKLVGFVHAGFGPDDTNERSIPGRLNTEIGTIAALIASPELEGDDIPRKLVQLAEVYLRRRGAKVIYFGGQEPLNPYYWGIYGGSEFSGVLSSDERAHRVASGLGYEPVSTTILLEADLDQPLPRDPRAAILRRQAHVSIHDEEQPRSWWNNLALGDFHPTLVTMTSKLEEEEIARATMWDMSWFSRLDGRARVGIVQFEVASKYRRRGFGKFLMSEILRTAHEQMFSVAQLQTNSANEAALALYLATGFHPIEEATLYRLPSDQMARSG